MKNEKKESTIFVYGIFRVHICCSVIGYIDVMYSPYGVSEMVDIIKVEMIFVVGFWICGMGCIILFGKVGILVGMGVRWVS